MSQKLLYTPPHVNRHDTEADYPAWTRDIVKTLRQEAALKVPRELSLRPNYTTVVDADRRYVQVSDAFCQLVGYTREELIGRRYDDLTAPNTNDIPIVFNLFSRLGYMQGLWMLVSQQGTRILVRYEALVRPDSYIEGRMELVGAS
jgi:PAS domain-containing protein